MKKDEEDDEYGEMGVEIRGIEKKQVKKSECV